MVQANAGAVLVGVRYQDNEELHPELHYQTLSLVS
jgi:hypothetical protein